MLIDLQDAPLETTAGDSAEPPVITQPPKRRGPTAALLGAPRARSIDPGRVGPVQTGAGLWWERHPHLTRAVAVLALLWGAAYLAWRFTSSWEGAQPLLSGLLLVVELFGWLSLLAFTVLSWRRPAARRPAQPAHQGTPSIDVYVCTYNEPIDVLRATLVGCRLLDHPHTTYVLDDGRRPEVAALAEELGAAWLTRPDNSHAKAGNINAALPRTRGDLVFILDADHVPLPDALDALAGYLDDPTVALVQSPHDFYNHDSAQHYELGRHEQSVFYSVILPGKDRHGAAFWCGSAALIRRSALMDIGGVATDTIAEDFHTTIKLQRHGWGTRYHDEVLVQGLAPHDLDSYLLQRDRWARGNLAVFTTPESPLRARELTVQQRLSYFASLAAYLAGPARALMIVVLAAVVWTGALPMHATALTLGVLWLPQIALGLLAAQALGRGFNRMAESVHFELCTAEIHLRALRCIVRPGRTTFEVTPKEGVDLGGWRAVRKLELAVLLTVALGLGLVLRAGHALGWMPFPTLPGLAAWVVPIVAVVELRRCARTLYLVGRRRQRRAEYRVSTQLDAVLAVGEHEGPVRLVDLAVSGVGFESAVPFAIGMPATMKVELPLVVDGARHVQLPIEVRSCRPSGSGWFVGARMTEPSPGARDAVIEYCHVVYPFRRLRGRPSVDLLTVPADAWRDLFPAPHASMRVAPAAA